MRPGREMDKPQQAIFHRYQCLPPELKYKIWILVFEDWSPGAHSFKLAIDPHDNMQLAILPFAPNGRDPSAWRERSDLASVDHFAKDALVKFERQKDITNIKGTRLRRGKVKDNNVLAKVNGRDDLLAFHFEYGMTRISLALLSVKANQRVFDDITQIGVKEEIIRLGFGLGSEGRVVQKAPFSCLCYPDAHGRFCYRTFTDFIRYFKDLKSFYIISTLKKKGISCLMNKIPSTGTWRLDLKHGKQHNVPLDCVRLLDYFQKMAERHDLKQFHDRKGGYCQVRERDAARYYPSAHKALRVAKSAIDRWNRQNEKPVTIDIKILARLDGINVQNTCLRRVN
ncbi:hypothetical protein GGS21DRAFT_163720 [Xylaria nigripes]|nr:hypothetical protein GGS21DRAFT_163720 [Xylaria nigripes]